MDITISGEWKDCDISTLLNKVRIIKLEGSNISTINPIRISSPIQNGIIKFSTSVTGKNLKLSLSQ